MAKGVFLFYLLCQAMAFHAGIFAGGTIVLMLKSRALQTETEVKDII